MADLIDRQAAIELIHTLYPSAPIMQMNRKRWEKKYKPYIEAEKALEKLPSVQPDIIRCRNCKFASGDSRICMKFGHSPIGELDFCAWAERRTDE